MTNNIHEFNQTANAELIKTISNGNRVRKLLGQMTLSEAKTVTDRFVKALEKLEQEAEEQALMAQKTKEKLRSALEEVSTELPINIDEAIEILLTNPGHNKALPAKTARGKRTPAPAKYEWIDQHGERRTWSGKGNIPDYIRQYEKDNGPNSRKDLLIS